MKKDTKSIEALERLFIRIIEDIKHVYGKNAFRKYDPQKKIWEKSVNRAIYDAVMICFANANSNEIAAKKDGLIEGLRELCETNTEFQIATTSSTKDRLNVKNRISEFRNMMVKNGVAVNDILFWD